MTILYTERRLRRKSYLSNLNESFINNMLRHRFICFQMTLDSEYSHCNIIPTLHCISNLCLGTFRCNEHETSPAVATDQPFNQEYNHSYHVKSNLMYVKHINRGLGHTKYVHLEYGNVVTDHCIDLKTFESGSSFFKDWKGCNASPLKVSNDHISRRTPLTPCSTQEIFQIIKSGRVQKNPLTHSSKLYKCNYSERKM